MTKRIGFAILTATITSFLSSRGFAQDQPAAKVATQPTVISRSEPENLTPEKGLKLNAPQAWKRVKPAEKRVAQFELPGGGDMAVFAFGDQEVVSADDTGGGGVDNNIERWVDLFQEDGRTASIKVADGSLGQYVFVEVDGTYVDAQKKAHPNSRLLAVILGVKGQGVFFFRSVGDDKVISAQKAGLRQMVGANAEKERDYKPGASSDDAAATPNS